MQPLAGLSDSLLSRHVQGLQAGDQLGRGGRGSATVWVATDSRNVVKVVATMPQMGGAKLTLELAKSSGSM